MTPTDAQYRTAAKHLHDREGECEVDTDAVVSTADRSEGAYVQAWIWIDADDASNEEHAR